MSRRAAVDRPRRRPPPPAPATPRVTGRRSSWRQLVALALVNAAVWLPESLTEWGDQLDWRNLAQTVEHEACMDAYAHV